MSTTASVARRFAFRAFVLVAFGALAIAFSREQLARTGGAWSAPLDDAFIHAAFARSAALGRPLHWIPTDGVSSGGTSVLWPLLLAIPWALGARGALIVPAGRALAVLLTALGFAALGATMLVASRVDAARRLGGILAAADAASLALAAAGNSPRIADGLPDLDASLLADMMSARAA